MMYNICELLAIGKVLKSNYSESNLKDYCIRTEIGMGTAIQVFNAQAYTDEFKTVYGLFTKDTQHIWKLQYTYSIGVF